MVHINKEILTKLKKKLMVLGLLSASIISSFNDNNILAKENNIAIEDTNEEKSTSELITYYSKVFDINEVAMYDKIDYLVYESANDIKVDEEFIISVALECYSTNFDNCRNAGYEYNPELAPEELIDRYSVIIGVNKYIAEAIMYGECKRPVSEDYNYKNHGNPGGMGTLSFPNGEAGIIKFLYMLRDGYGVSIDSESEVFSYMAPVYCPPKAEFWKNQDTSLYNELMNNGFYSRAPQDVKERNKELTLK